MRASIQDILAALPYVARERRDEVLADIHQGSTPTALYYVLLGTSALIAGFGLLADSAAVVIGAMLVSPLMTPIFGISVGLTRGNSALVARGMMAVFGGALLAIFLCFLLGLLPFSLEQTEEMLARTKPTLLDLFVATLAGLAGCVALIDARISAALPGVAIATALTPPLATSGLSLAFGHYQGAWGAFLLFFANLLAILFVAAIIFTISGFVTKAELGTKKDVVRRFWVATVGLLVVTGLLTHYLVGMVQNYRTNKAIATVLEEQLAAEPDVTLQEFVFDRDQKHEVDVLATVRTPRVLTPRKVQSIEAHSPKDSRNRCACFFDVRSPTT